MRNIETDTFDLLRALVTVARQNGTRSEKYRNVRRELKNLLKKHPEAQKFFDKAVSGVKI